MIAVSEVMDFWTLLRQSLLRSDASDWFKDAAPAPMK